MQTFHLFLHTVPAFPRNFSQVVVAIGSHCYKCAAIVTEGAQGLAILNSELRIAPLTVEVSWQDLLHEGETKV